jgi:hypothetical protein
VTLFAVVELMGHRTRAGAISDATMSGATLLRIEHPERVDHTGDAMLAEYYAPAAIFSIRPCSKEEATKVATWAWREAVARPALGPAFREYLDEDEVDAEILDERCDCDDEGCCPECDNRHAAALSHEEPF